ncbi:MAG: histidinol dehydrogenase [Chloroflexi bacterium]|nr:histidinol dehydrogenase [Chloroflexota bacterium]
MNIIRDIDAARKLLSRRPRWDVVETPVSLQEGLRTIFGEGVGLEQAVDRIISDVRARGDAALLDYTRRIDQASLTNLEVHREEIAAASSRIDGELLSALKLAAGRVRAFHEAQRRQSWMDFSHGALGQIVRPLERVGVYAPGGTACYPSTVLMTAIPARVAGVDQIVLATPPKADGSIAPALLAAANVAGVDRVFKLGGAQAVAALAFGTQSVPKVDKICGPGNIFVTLAKKKVFGVVAIDGLHGPTETLIIADDSANPAFCAADLLAQAEHDVLASAILVATSAELAGKVKAEVELQLMRLERRDLAARALDTNGQIIVVANMDTALELANLYAPEHLCLLVREPWSLVGRIRHAGGIFMGEKSLEALGDYVAGPSHVMPTGGTARFSSPLSVNDFIKIISLVAVDETALKDIGPAAVAIARAEGLTAHARAVEMRLKPPPKSPRSRGD